MINVYHSIFDQKFDKIFERIKSNSPNLNFVDFKDPNNIQFEENVTLSNNDYLMIAGWKNKQSYSIERNVYLEFIKNKGRRENVLFLYNNNIGLNVSNFTAYKLCFKSIRPHLSLYSFTNDCNKFSTEPIADWKKNGKFILIALNSTKGWNTARTNPVTWTSDLLYKLYDKKVLLLPHPQDQLENNFPACFKRITIENFDAVDPNDLYCSIVYNSNFAIKSITTGVPVISLDRHNLVHRWCDKNLEAINNLNYNVDRLEMLKFLSKIMYTENELCNANIENIITGNKLSLKEYYEDSK